MKKILWVVAFGLVWSAWGGAPVRAAGQTTPDAVSGLPEGTIQVASVNIYNPTLHQEGRSAAVAFTLANEAGVQGQVKYGVELTRIIPGENKQDSKEPDPEILLTRIVSPEVLSLGEGERQFKTFSFMIPEELSGDMRVWVKSWNDSGLLLALNPAGMLHIDAVSGPRVAVDPQTCFVSVVGAKLPIAAAGNAYTLSQGVDVSDGEGLSVSCSFSNATTADVAVTPSFTAYRRIVGIGMPVSEATKTGVVMTLPAGSTQLLSFEVPLAAVPQAYDTQVSFVDASGHPLTESITVHYVRRGASATIKNLTFDKMTYASGDTANAQLFWVGSADNFQGSRGNAGTAFGTLILKAEMVDASGTACAKPFTKSVDTGQINNGYDTLTFAVTAPCQQPKLRISLLKGDGTLLDEDTFESPTSNGVVRGQSPLGWESDWLKLGGLGVVFLLVIAGLVWRSRRVQGSRLGREESSRGGMKVWVWVLIGGSALVGSARTADAFSYYNPSTGNGYTINVNSPVVQPGEVQTVSTSSVATWCENSNALDVAALELEGTVGWAYFLYQDPAPIQAYCGGSMSDLPPAIDSLMRTMCGNIHVIGSAAVTSTSTVLGPGHYISQGTLTGQSLSAVVQPTTTPVSRMAWRHRRQYEAIKGAFGYTDTGWEHPGTRYTVNPNIPSTTFAASPTMVAAGEASTVSWTATNSPTSCYLYGGIWGGQTPVSCGTCSGSTCSGSASTGALASTTGFSFNSCNASGCDSGKNLWVTAIPKPTVNASAAPNPVAAGGGSVISFSSSGAPNGCYFDWDWVSHGASGAVTVYPTAPSQTYGIYCYDALWNYTARSVTVDVSAPPIPGACGSGPGNYCVNGTTYAGDDNGLTACGINRAWTCNGLNGGTPASCSVPNAACAVCGPAKRGYPGNATGLLGALCGTGSNLIGTTPVLPPDATPVSWTCQGSSGDTTMCTASRTCATNCPAQAANYCGAFVTVNSCNITETCSGTKTAGCNITWQEVAP